MQRFFIDTNQFVGDKVVFSQTQSHQLRKVLRMTGGEHVIVLDNRGGEFEVVLEPVGRVDIRADIVARQTASGEPAVAVTLYQSLLRSDKFELVLQKCTEVGIRRFVPVITRRSLIRDAKSVTDRKLARWNKIVTEAAEQSHRGIVPTVEQCTSLKEAVSDCGGLDCRIAASTSQQAIDLADAIKSSEHAVRTLGLFIGPEGGFSDDELTMFDEAGVISTGLGPRILRTETAAVVAGALVLYELGQMAGR